MKNLTRSFFSITLVFSLLLLPACIASNTEIQANWHDVNYSKGPMKGILLLLVTKDIFKRKIFEDSLNQFFEEKGIKSVVGYKVFPPDIEITEELVKSCLVGVDADAILVTNIMGVKKEKEVIPGDFFPSRDIGSSFSTHYTRSYRSYHIPPKVVEVENLYLDSRLYRCDSEKLLWQLHLKISNLKPFNKVVKEFSKVVFKDLSKKNLL